MLDVLAAGILAYTIAVAGYLSVRTWQFRRAGSLIENLVHAAFVPEKRRRYLLILTVEGNLLIWGTLAWSAMLGGLIPPGIGTLVLTGLLVAGVGSVAALTELGFRAPRLSETDRARVEQEIPQILHSLALMPAVQSASQDQEVGR